MSTGKDKTTRPLRVLLVEDSPDDAALIERTLVRERGPTDILVVETREDMRAALANREFDVVISDWSLPLFDAPSALRVLIESGLDVPFIIASGTVGEETAVQAMRSGANDYVLKDKLVRLAPAIDRELRDAQVRRAARDAQRELELQAARFRALIERSSDGITLTDENGILTYVSPATARIFGFEASDIIGTSILRLVDDDDRSAVVALMAANRARAGETLRHVIRARRADGTRCWLEARTTNLLDDPAVRAVVSNLRDITEEERIREQLSGSEERYRRIVETTNEGVWLANETGIVTFANGRLGTILATSPVGRSVAELFGRHIEPAPAHRQVEASVRRADGSTAVCLIETSPIVDAHGRYEGQLGVVMDVTALRAAEHALRQTQAQLLQAQKLEAVGRLAGGIAHDFNNVLTVILTQAEFLTEEPQMPRDFIPEVEEIINAGRRAAELTRQLLLFSRQQVVEPVVFEIGDLVDSMQKMLRRLVGEDVRLTVRLPSTSACIRADRGQIEQVVMNLVVNARDAMPRGGALDIAAEVVDGGTQVQLTVRDTGAGMSPETQQRMYEPFFTTKERGKGTGLGLSTVFGIVQSCGGTIHVDSVVGEGTTFKVLIPRTTATPVAPEPSQDGAALRGTETVLLVEDEESVRAVTCTILERAGYKVHVAQNPEHAIQLAREHAIDLLLTDVVMPGTSGPALARRVRELQPSCAVVCMSGYIDDAVVRHGVLDEGYAFLQKPFTPEPLLQKLRGVLTNR